MNEKQRMELLKAVAEIRIGSFDGTIADLAQVLEAYLLRIGIDEEFLVGVAQRNHVTA